MRVQVRARVGGGGVRIRVRMMEEGWSVVKTTVIGPNPSHPEHGG